MTRAASCAGDSLPSVGLDEGVVCPEQLAHLAERPRQPEDLELGIDRRVAQQALFRAGPVALGVFAQALLVGFGQLLGGAQQQPGVTEQIRAEATPPR
jgi:hypothetical protein